jgi:hypothetical protein
MGAEPARATPENVKLLIILKLNLNDSQMMGSLAITTTTFLISLPLFFVIPADCCLT